MFKKEKVSNLVDENLKENTYVVLPSGCRPPPDFLF